MALHAANRAARRHPRRGRARRLRRALPAALGAPGALRLAVPEDRREQPAPYGADPGAARPHRRPQRPADRHQRPGNRGPDLAGQSAQEVEGGARRAAGPVEDPRRAGAADGRADQEARRRSGHSGDGQGRGPRRTGQLPLRTRIRVSGSRDRVHLPAPLSVRRARRAAARLHGRDLGRSAEAARQARLPRRRRRRDGGSRGLLRPGPPRRPRHLAAPCRLARPAALVVPADDDAAPRTRAPPHDRPRRAAGGGERAPLRDPDRARQQGVLRGRRRDRRDRPARRRHPRAGVEPNLQAERLRREDRPAEAQAAPRPGRRRARELPDAEPGDRGPVSARLDLQAGHGARRHAGAHPLAVCVDPVHGDVHLARGPLEAGLPQLGSERLRADDAADRARRLLRHLLLRAREPLLQPAARGRPPAAAVGKPLRLRPGSPPRHRSRRGRPPAHARVAQGHVHQEDRPDPVAGRPPLEAGRLDPAGDRPEGPARHADADGAVLRADRERRSARDAARPARRRAGFLERPAWPRGTHTAPGGP